MRALFEIVPALVLLYGTFLLGQVNQRRKNADKRDPHEVVRTSRNVLAAHNYGSPNQTDLAYKELQLAVDEWDAKAR